MAVGLSVSYPTETEAVLPLYSEDEIKDVWSFTSLSPSVQCLIAAKVLCLLLLPQFTVAVYDILIQV
jgi:hypothetical protein